MPSKAQTKERKSGRAVTAHGIRTGNERYNAGANRESRADKPRQRRFQRYPIPHTANSEDRLSSRPKIVRASRSSSPSRAGRASSAYHKGGNAVTRYGA